MCVFICTRCVRNKDNNNNNVSHHNSAPMRLHKIVSYILSTQSDQHVSEVHHRYDILLNIKTSHFVSTIQRIQSTDMCPTCRMGKTHYPWGLSARFIVTSELCGAASLTQTDHIPQVCRSHSAVERPESVPHIFSSTSGS